MGKVMWQVTMTNINSVNRVTETEGGSKSIITVNVLWIQMKGFNMLKTLFYAPGLKGPPRASGVWIVCPSVCLSVCP